MHEKIPELISNIYADYLEANDVTKSRDVPMNLIKAAKCWKWYSVNTSFIYHVAKIKFMNHETNQE